MENSKSSFFLQILQDLSSKSASIRYHSQYALRSFSVKDSATVINEFAEYFRSVSTLEPRILNELTYLIKNLHQDDKSGVGGLHSIFQSIEKLCHNAQTITCSIELLNLCETFFTTFPDLFFRLCDPSKNMPIVTTLTASQFISINPKSSNITSSSHSIHTSNSTSDSTSKFAIVEHADLFLEKNDDSIFFKYASVLFLSALFPFSSRLSPNSLKIYKLKSLEFINFFLNKPIDAFSQYFPILLPLNFPDDPNECSEMLRKLSIISRENPKIAHFLIPSLLSLLGNSFAEADIEIVIESLLPTLSLIPFHFSSSLPDESVVDGFKMAVQAVQTLYQKNTKVFSKIVSYAKNGTIEQRLGCQYCITCLIKLDMKLNFSDFAVIFEKIESPLEVGTLAELTLALLSKNIPFMNWKEVIDLLEILYSQANDITRQYPLDTAFELGKTIDCDQSDFFEFLSTQISTKFKYASIYFSILDSFISIRKDEITIDSLNPTIIMYLCLFVILKSGKCLNNLETLIPELKEPENIYNFIKTLNSNLHSPIARSILHKYHSIENVRTIICRFLICLIPNCSTNEARLNVNACVSVLQNDFESNIELISILYSSYIDLDPNTAIQSLGNFVSSLSKGWFIFSSPVKYVLIINLVFSILDKLEINIQSFYQFASEHLPEVTDLESSSIALKCLANTFRKIPKLDYEFPPKCRLFDFVIAASEPNNNDVFMCIASLLPIPPICPSEHIPIVTNLILKSKIDISDEMIQMLKSALLIAETPNDIKLLIEPFVEHIKENVPYSLLLSILESLSGQISKPKYSSDHFQIDNINSSQVNESEISDDFISLGIDTSSKLNENNDVSFDDFLSLMSETIGICLPLFEQTHLAVEFILIIMSKLTQKIEIKSKLSLHEAVKYISSTFNSQCLFNVASFLCHNQTMASVTAFIILLQERESEMLHCVHSFVSNLLNSKQPNISLIFEANETLAKAAASLITIDNFDIIKTALKNTKYASSIIDVLKEMLVSKCQELKMILDDPELTNLVDHESVEMQFVKVLTNSHPSDIEKWNEEKKLDFLSILETYINQLPKEQQLKFAHFVSNIQETNCIAKSIHIFSPFFKDNDFMTYFATSLLVLPVLIQTNENNIRALKYIIPISLQNKESLSVIKDYIHYVLLSLLKSSECIQNLKKQYNFEIILKPHLPLIISTLLGPTNEEIVELFMLISNEKIEPHPNSFVSIIDICKTLKLDDISPNCIKTLIEKASKGTKTKNLCALVVLSYFCKRNILDEKITRQVLFLSQQLLNYDDQSEEVKTASLICLSCFPLNLLLSAK